MSLSGFEYLVGLAEAAVSLAAFWWAAVLVRHRVLPGWTGASARVVEAIVTTAALTCGLQLLALVGILSGVAIAAIGVVFVATCWLWTKRWFPESAEVAGAGPKAGESPGWMSGFAAVVAAISIGIWMTGVQSSLALGMQGFDTLWYHGPFAARIADTGSFLPLHFTDTSYLNWFYPENSELLHAAGIAWFGHDLLSVWIGIAWLGLALTSGWAMGRPWGLAPLTMTAVACALVGGALVPRSAGTAATDIEPIALMVAAAAVLVNASSVSPGGSGLGGRKLPGAGEIPLSAVAVAGLAVGAALGTKLTVGPAAAVMGIGLMFWGSSGSRWRTLAIWALAVALPSVVWFVRNIVYSGSPLPFGGAGPLDSPNRGLEGRDPFSVAHYLFDSSTAVESTFFNDGLVSNLGHLWPLIALSAVGGVVTALWRGSPGARVVALGCLAGGVTYLFTPLTAAGPEGTPIAFEINFRYVLPALVPALGLLVLDPIVAGRQEDSPRRTWWLIGSGVIFLSVVLPGIGSGSGGSWSEPRVIVPVALGVGALVAATAFLLPRLWSSNRPLAMSIGAVVALAVAAAGYPVSRSFVDSRYEKRVNDRVGGFTMTQAARWAAGTQGVRIGVAGSSGAFYQYPLFGRGLDNWVQYIGRETSAGGFEEIRRCRAWRAAVNRGNYDWLVVTPTLDLNRPSVVTASPEITWVKGDPSVDFLRRRGDVWIFQVTGELSPDRCTPLRRAGDSKVPGQRPEKLGDTG